MTSNFISEHVAETMRKIRTTARFMLGNLDGFSEARAAKYTDLKEVNSHIMNSILALLRLRQCCS